MSSAALKKFLITATPDVFVPYWRRLQASPIGYRVAKGAFWTLLGTVVSRSLNVISSVFVARMLGKVGMGELGMIQATVGIFSAIAGLGMGLTATKYVAEYRTSDSSRAAAMLRLSSRLAWMSGACLSLMMAVLAPWFARHTIAAPHLGGVLRLGSVLLLLGAVNGAQTGALAGFEAFSAIARVNLLAGLASLPLMLAGAHYGGLAGAVWGLIGSGVVNCILSHVHLRRAAASANLPLHAPFASPDWNALWKFSIPSVLCGLLIGPINWVCNALLVNTPNGYAEMGLFNVTLAWFSAVTFLPGVLAQVLLPILSSQQISSQPTAARDGSSRKIVFLAIKANAAAVLPFVLAISCASPVITSLYGPEFREGWPTLVITVLTAGVVALHGPAAQYMIASDRLWPYLLMHIGWGLALVGATLFLARFGACGLATARLIAYTLSSTAVFLYVARFCRPSSSC